MSAVPDRSVKSRAGSRTCWGPLPVWQNRWVVGRAWVNLMRRASLRLNVNVEIYGRGKYPYLFKKKNLLEAATTRIPLPMLREIARELGYTLEPIPGKAVRIQKTSEHRWKRRRFRSRET